MSTENTSALDLRPPRRRQRARILARAARQAKGVVIRPARLLCAGTPKKPAKPLDALDAILVAPI